MRYLIPGSNKGFTLTETVFSIVLLAIAWLTVFEVVVITKVSGSVAKHKIQAAYVAQRALEDLHRKPFSQIVSSNSTASVDTRGTPDLYTDDLAGSQTVTVSVVSTHIKKVVVEVSWKERLVGTTKSMTERLASLITDDPQTN